MKPLNRILIILIVPAILTSCFSKMKVTVDIFDYNALKESREYSNSEAEKLLAFFAELLDLNKNDEFVNKAVKNYKVKIESGIIQTNENNKNSVIESISNYSKDYTSKFKNSISIANDLLKSNKFKNYDSAFTLYLNAKKELIQNFKNLSSELEDSSLKNNDVSSFSNYILSDFSKRENDYTFGASIMDDRFASMVVSAPEKYWKQYDKELDIKDITTGSKRSKSDSRVNYTLARTWFGNSDVAIKMDSPGNFVVKGVRVDSDEAIKASFKVLNQGIKYLAYASGIPIQGKASGGNETGEVKIPELLENSKLSHELNTVSNQSGSFTKAFINSLIIELRKMEKGDTNSVSRIKKSFEVYKKILLIEKTK